MPRINLLPWRDEQRAQIRNQFYVACGIALGVAALFTFMGSFTMSTIIDAQYARNNLLEIEIKALDERIAEILGLEKEKDRLVARMKIIEQLQQSRPEIVHVFDELVRALPDGVYLISVKQSGQRLEIRGAAESNTRVSAFMRNLDKSEWFLDPDLEVVKVKDDRSREGMTASEFIVIARQVVTNSEMDI